MSITIILLTASAVSADINETDFSNLDDGDVIHLENATYFESEVTIDKSITVVGNDSTFDGRNQNSLFKITGNSSVTFENVKFANYRASTNGAVFDIDKSSSLILLNCTFLNNTMAIRNLGSLSITDSHFSANNLDAEYTYGGAIANEGRLQIENSTFENSYGPQNTRGATIYNNGDMTMTETTISRAYACEDSKGSAIFNNGICRIINSIIESNAIERYDFNYMHGVIYNQGTLTAVGCIFTNNTGRYVKPNTWYEGSPNIYNVGDLNLSYNAFIGNVYFNGLSLDVFSNGARHISLDSNWWSSNANPLDENKINEGNVISNWIVLDLTPSYAPLDINGTVLIRALWKLNTGEDIDGPLPDFTIKMSDGERTVDSDSFLFNNTMTKGSYTVTAKVCNFTTEATVDVGKIPVYVEIIAGNVTYPEPAYVEFKSNTDQNITVNLNGRDWTVKIDNGRGNITFANLDAGEYELKVTYEGDEDHFRAFNRTVINVAKMMVTLTIENVSDIRVDEIINAKVILNPNVSPVTTQLYINGALNKTLYLYDSINNLTFRNLKEGRYDIQIMISQTENYFSANATATFNVGRYDPRLNISVESVRLGENAIAEISAHNFTGNVILSVNGINSTVLIRNNTNITIPGLEGGRYEVSVIFNGDELYLPSNATATFQVIRDDPQFNVTVNESGIITVTTLPDCTGRVGLYVNFDVYYANLTGGVAVFNVEFDSGTNYIFAFYDGDRMHENATYNTTLTIDGEFIIVGNDVEAVEHNNFTYSIVLVEKNRITMPDRHVSITFNGVTYDVVTDRDGIAAVSLNLACGSYEISASYKNQTVTNSILVRPLTFRLEASDISYSQTEVIRAIFDANVTGNVRFEVSNINETVAINGSQSSFELSGLGVGSYNVRATYFNGIIERSLNSTFTVKRANPNVNIKAENILPGQDELIVVTFLDNISGEVRFYFESEHVVEISDSKAMLRLEGLDIGIYEVLITFDGNENYTNFTRKATFAVRNETSPIELLISDTRFGQDLIVKAVLNQTALGNVTFRVSDRAMTVNVISGEATCTFDNLGAGTYRIDAQYNGDLTFTPSSAYGFARVLKADSTVSIITDEITLGENIMIYAILPEDATGEVYFSMVGYYSPRAKQVENGQAFWYISPLEAGRYTVVANYRGDANYNPANATFTLKVSQTKTILAVSINDASVNDRVVANVKLTDVYGQGITDKVRLNVNSRVYNINVINGEGKLVIGRLNPGSYIFSAAYEGDGNYSTSSAAGSFTVAENLLETTLTVNNVTAYYKGLQELKITLTSNNKPVSGASLTVKVNNVEYVLTTDIDGMASVKLDLNPGRYAVTVAFNETLSHSNSSATALITVLSSINATDVVKLYGSGTQYFAMFYEANGKALGNKEVSFKLNGNVYKVKTLPNGVVRLNININPGTYKITAINPSTGEKAVNTIRIYAKIMNNRDLTQYYGAKKVYKVRIYNATTGKPVGAGHKVKFKVNKKTITAKTDKNGYASMKINLKAGKYAITASYDGYKVSNRITVKPVLTAKDILGINVKKVKFKVKLVNKNGKALKGKKIKFKFKGKTYNAKTNRKGIASVTLKNLKVGKYKIHSTYGKSKITNVIRIKK